MLGTHGFLETIHDDNQIKKITSGIKKVTQILEKNVEEHFVLVKVIAKNGKESLGIRWFWDNNGFPSSRGWGTWLIIDKAMAKCLANNYHIKNFCK